MQTLLATYCSLHVNKHQENYVNCLYLHSFYSKPSHNIISNASNKSEAMEFFCKLRNSADVHQIVENHGLFNITDVAWLMILLECKLHSVPMVNASTFH